MKRAFIVMGPPSSGTRLITRLLIAAGCEGDGDHHQRYDDTAPMSDLIVFRRHMPDRRIPKWADDENIITAVQRLGYTVTVVIANRDWHCTIKSQLAAPHAADVGEAYDWLRDSWRLIFKHLPDDVDFHIVNYESLVQRPYKVTATLCEQLGLKRPSAIEYIIDGNEKHFRAVTT